MGKKVAGTGGRGRTGGRSAPPVSETPSALRGRGRVRGGGRSSSEGGRGRSSSGGGRGRGRSSSGGGETPLKGRGRSRGGVRGGSRPSRNRMPSNDKDIVLRCRPHRMVCFFENFIAPNISEHQRAKLNETPFGHLFEMTPAIVSNSLFKKIFQAFNPQSKVFEIAGVSVPFTYRDVGLALGLKEQGTLLHLYSDTGKKYRTGNKQSPLYQKYFPESDNEAEDDGRSKVPTNHVQYKKLEEHLKALVGKDDLADDFVSLLVLYLFSMVLFPLANGRVNLPMIPFVEKLETLPDFAWARTVHQVITQQMVEARNNTSNKKNLCIGGCAISVIERSCIFISKSILLF